ncbi:MAG: GNAT family N-acetyltransferase [Aliarcobacter cryaerophilus]|nr:GNAT family N-acetyltransferase [Aliarcobacter cryaerophilus]
MQDLKFRVFKKDDIKAVVELINKAYRENNPNSWTSEAHLLSGIRVNEDIMSEILQDKTIVTYITLLDEKIVATIQTKLEDEDIHIGLFAVHPGFQSFGVGKKLLAYAEESSKKLWKKSSFVMEVISNRVELRDYYIRRGYQNTNSFIEFPKSSYWSPLTNEELKLLVLRKEILR